MRPLFSIAVSATAAYLALSLPAQAAGNMSHTHMGHVTSGWGDTPGTKGLLPTAISEAQTAASHAGLAAKKPGDLKWMQTHAAHVLNAIDPSAQATGPGLGYGVIKAASGAARHIGLAAKSEGASENVKVHAAHVSTSSENTVTRAQAIAKISAEIQHAKTAAEAAPMVQEMLKLSEALINGVDANGDGDITWKAGEGGLKVADKHMSIMAQIEGL